MRRSPTVVLLAAAAFAQATAAAEPERFRESTSVLAVEIPVQVTLDGEPVRGLSAANFEVSEGRRKLAITGFEVADLTDADASAAPGDLPLRRHILFLFDLGADPGWVERARVAAIGSLATAFHPSDLLAVAAYRPYGASRLLLGFTSDRRQVEQALAALGAKQRPAAWSPDPLGLTVATDVAPGKIASEAIREWYEGLEADAGRNVLEDRAAQLVGVTRTLDELAARLAAVRGRKTVVFLSPGYDDSVLVGNAPDERTRAAGERGEIWDIAPGAEGGSTQVQNALQDMLESFRRADCVIEAVDISGLAGAVQAGDSPRIQGTNFLTAAAQDTGGQVHLNTNDLGLMMRRALRRSLVTYVLTVQPEGVVEDGKYHRLRVELRGAPHGAEASYRSGYYAPLPYAKRSLAARRLETAELLLGGREPGSIDIESLALALDYEGARGFTPLVVDIAGKPLVARGGERPVPIEVFAYAFDEAGTIAGYLVETFTLDPRVAGEAFRRNGVKFFGHLDLLPGRYTVRVLARSAADGEYGLRETRLVVPDDGAVESSFSPPLLQDDEAWAMARETSRPSSAPYPFTLRGQPFVPAARARLSPEVPVSLVLYARNAPPLPTASAIVLDDTGQTVSSSSTVVLRGRSAAASLRREEWHLEFTPVGLRPGKYQLVLQSVAQDGQRTASPPISIEIQGR